MKARPLLFVVATSVFSACSSGTIQSANSPQDAGGSDAASSTGGGMSASSGGATPQDASSAEAAMGSSGGSASSGSGGSTGSSGTAGSSGSSASSSTSGSSGVDSGPAGVGPCDIFQSGNTPCVAAHSTVRALYKSYDGNLYQVRRASDSSTKDIPVLAPGGFVDSSVQDSFCSNTTCTISIIYDQSPQKNDLTKSPPVSVLPGGGKEAPASNGKTTVGGHPVYGVYIMKNQSMGYRLNTAKGTATGDDPEAIYMVVDGTRSTSDCCFDYGNVETSGRDDGNATMEAIYFGSDMTYGGQGAGKGPWIAADLENGMYEGPCGGYLSSAPCSGGLNDMSNQSVIADYASLVLKGLSGNQFTLKAGDAQSGMLSVHYDGVRPQGYSPQHKQGAIVLGTGGDGSDRCDGTFFEGAMTAGSPTDAIDDEVQANIVAAGYGK